MANYRRHLSVSATLGVAYGAAGVTPLGMETATAVVGAGVTAVAGLAPDLDSDSGKPIRELFGIAAGVTPIVLLPRITNTSFSPDEVLITLALIYCFVRYGLARVLRRITVHRGMWHSVPAMMIAGFATFLAYDNPSLVARAFVALGAALGFFSHLLLDEAYSVDFSGGALRLNKFAGSALKFGSSSAIATCLCYFLLGVVAYLSWVDLEMNLGHSPVTLVLGEVKT